MTNRLTQLYTELQAASVGDELFIIPTVIPIPQITTLIERLPDQQLVLHGATIQLQPTTLTVTGRSLQAWPVRGIVAAQIKEMVLHLLIAESPTDSSLRATLTVAGGNLSLGQISLTVSGSYEHDVFKMGLQTPPPATFALATLTDLATNGDLVSYLPTVPLLFDAVSLSEFTLHFSFVETIPTELTLGVNILGDWPIVESPIALRLRNLQATILSHWTLVDEELLAFTAGNLLGTLQIGQDFDIRLPFLGGHLLEIDVIPHNGDLLLGLPAIAEWLGGVTLRNAVQNGLAALDLGEIVLDEVRIVFNIASKSLFSLGILSHIHIIDLQSGLNVVVDLYLQPPLGEAAGWQFAGTTGTGQALPIGKLILYLAHKFNLAVATPTVLESLVIDNLGIAFNTQTGDVSFTCRGHLQIGVDSAGRAEQVEAQVTIEVTRNTTTQSYSVAFRGYLLVEGLQFDLNFSYDPTATSLVAAFDHSQNNVTNVAGENFNSFFGDTIRVHNLLSQISPEVADIIPESLEVELKNVLFAYSNHDSVRKFLFGPNIGVHLSLADLPLLGHAFPADQTLGFDDLQLLFVSNSFTLLETNALNTLIPDHVNKLPTTALVDANGQPTEYALIKGFSVAARLRLSNTVLPFSFTISTSQPSTLRALPLTSTTRAGGAADTTTTPVRWIKIQRSFGPLHFARIGILYQDEAILILLDASLAVGGLTLALDGLAVGSKVDHFSPQFRLNGLSVDYRNGPVELGGALLRVERDGREEYDGTVILRTTALTLGALGSYTYLNGHPSFFVYALLDYPLGGPAFFFVTGLAAGFGFNRRLTMPTIDQVATFPLVQWASDPASSPTANNQGAAALLGALTGLSSYIPPSTGDYFLAVGIKFTSFKLLDSFALLAVAFGKRFELDLLGLSTLIAPTPIPGDPAVSPLAEAQLALKASFIPDEGFLGVQAQLTANSFLLARACHLTGGFAFFSWFSGPHAGDFVVTLGGYHPDFAVPEHYPKPPRLGFNWRVNNELSLKGDAYYALTAGALMAGGHLEATWQSGDIQAWFKAGADFLIGWKPYHYEAHVYVDIGVAAKIHFFGTHHLKLQVGADLQLWGPEFAGKAKVHLHVISFTIHFGDEGGKTPQPITWDAFGSSFLPEPTAVCTVVGQAGLVRQVEQDAGKEKAELGIFHPQALRLLLESAIPIKQVSGLPVDGAPNTAWGIAPMGLRADAVQSTLTVQVMRAGTTDVTHQFAFTAVNKAAPAALWGQTLKPDLKDDRFINDTWSGFTLAPKAAATSGATASIDGRLLLDSTTLLPWHYTTTDRPDLTPQDVDDPIATVHATIATATTDARRAALLAALGMDTVVTVNSGLADALLGTPQIVTMPVIS